MWTDPRDGLVYRALMNLSADHKTLEPASARPDCKDGFCASLAFPFPISSNAPRPPPDLWRGKIEEIGVHCAISTLSCLLHPKAHGTYPAGATFGSDRQTR